MASLRRVIGCGLASSLLVALITSSAAAQTDAPSFESSEAPPPREPLTLTHTYLEGRLGAIAQSPLGVRDDEPMRFGGAFEGSAGIGFRWLDLGLTARYGTIPSTPSTESRLSYVGFGPEIAARKALGDGATLRVGLVPMYAIAWDSQGASRRIGVDALAQLLFTIDNQSRPAWRAGIGLRAGRYATLSADDPGWSMGIDLLARSWW
jgi:hypothetical protein